MNFTNEKNRIYYKALAEITFPNIDENTVDINHTFVDSSLSGQGIASQLCKAAYQQIKSSHVKAIVTCSYAKHWFEKHPEYQDVLKKDSHH